MAEPQHQPQPPPGQQHAYAQYAHPDPQQPQPYDPNQQQAAAPYDPSYEAHYAAYYQQQQQYYDPNAYQQQQQQHQQYYDYAQAYPHLQPDQAQIHPQQFHPASYHHYPQPQPEANRGGRRGGGQPFRGRGGRHGRGRGRGGGRNPGRFAPAGPQPSKLPAFKIWCDICRVECSSLDILEQHKNGKRHKKTVQKFEEMQKQQKMFTEYQSSSMPGTMYPNVYQPNAMHNAVHGSAYQPSNIMPGTVHTTGYYPANAVPNAVQTSGYQQETPSVSSIPSGTVSCNAPEVAEQKNVSSVPDSSTTAEASSAQVVDHAKASETADSIVQVDDASKSHSVGSGQNAEVKAATTEGTTELPNHVVNRNQLDGRKGSIKRKPIRYGRGGKKLKRSDPRYVPERPRVCTLCNVTSETQMAFDTHIAGKKHNSKLKRLQHQGAVFGPITIYIPPNQPTPYPIRGPEPLYYGLNTYNTVNQVTFNMEGNQDAPLVFVSKQNNALGTDIDGKVTDHVALESESKETSDAIGAKNDDNAIKLDSNGKDNLEANVGLGSESKETNENTQIDNAAKNVESLDSEIAKDSSLDCDSKEKNSVEAGHDLKDNAGSDS